MLDDYQGVAKVLNNLGSFYYRRGEWDLALEQFEMGLDVKMRQGDIEGAVEMQSNIDMITSSKDEAKSNIDDYQKQLRDVEAGRPKRQGRDLGGLSQRLCGPIRVGCRYFELLEQPGDL
jgi:hypothetical protein